MARSRKGSAWSAAVGALGLISLLAALLLVSPTAAWAVTVDMDVAGVADGDELDPGECIEKREGGSYNTNGAPGAEVLLRKCTPSDWTGSVILTRSSTNLKVYTNPTCTTEITFNGTNNKWANSSLMVTVYVQSDNASSSMRDEWLKLSVVGDLSTYDQINFTVLWVTIAGDYSDGDDVAVGNSARADDFGKNLLLRRNIADGKLWFNSSVYYSNSPTGDDTSLSKFRDDNPQSGGSSDVFDDLGAPGILNGPNMSTGYYVRMRTNFQAYAEYDGTRCSDYYPWYVRQSYQKTGDSESGTADADSTQGTLKDAAKSWTTDKWEDGVVQIYSGTGAVQFRRITGNTSNTLSITPNWQTTPNATSEYEVLASNAWTLLSDVQGDNQSADGTTNTTWDPQ